MSLFVIVLLLCVCVCVFLAAEAEPNPPKWPSHVYVFNTSDISYAQQIIAEVYKENGGTSNFHGQFSNDRFALMFTPGTYNIDVNVGYYTSIIGLGKTPQQTQIQNVISQNGADTSLCNFWRSAENFYTKPTKTYNNNGAPSMLWATSQACPLRRVYVDGQLFLWSNYGGAGWSSGGFMADMTVTGKIMSGTQQQFYTRNTAMASWEGSNWNMVFQGNVHAPNNACPGKYTAVATTPVIAEKPFIAYDAGKFYLMVPDIKYNSNGPSDYADASRMQQIDFASVYVTDPDTDTGASISAKLAAGLHVVLSAGNYNLQTPITIAKPNLVVLGIGFPTLISSNGNPVVAVGTQGENVDGVRIAGVLLQAGTKKSTTLLQWGATTDSAAKSAALYPGSAANPGFLYDLFARVGGPTNSKQVQVSTESMVQINSGNVVVDGSWLWRADHDTGGSVANSANPVNTGIEIYGQNVTTYGLAVEHTLADLVSWKGNAGKCFFYQSEFPYDVTQANYGDPGYVSFRVDNSVTEFEGHGLGAYSYFRDHSVTVANGFEVPAGKSGVRVSNAFSIFLSGNGGINHVIDNNGGSATSHNADQLVQVCNCC